MQRDFADKLSSRGTLTVRPLSTVDVRRHSRLESFLKRNLNCGRERVVHYEGCVILRKSRRPSAAPPPPFYAFLILTDRRLLLTELPPKKLKPFVELDRIGDIVSVAEEPPCFLFDPHREVAQRIRIVYAPPMDTRPNGRSASSSRDGDGSPKTWSSDLSEMRTVVSSSSSTSGSGSTGSKSSYALDCTTSADVFLLLPSSDFGHVMYVTWIQRLTSSRSDCDLKTSDLQDADGSARYQWLVHKVAHHKEVENRCPQLHQQLRDWSCGCTNFAKLVWQDSRIVDWLLSKLKEAASEEDDAAAAASVRGMPSKFNPSRALAAIFNFANRDAVCRILDAVRCKDIVKWLTVATKRKTVLSADCIELTFAILSLPCSIFSAKLVELLLLADWIVIIACIATGLVTIVRRNHVSTEDCLSLFKCLFVLLRFLRLDTSRRVVRYLFNNHSDELRYFGSYAQLCSKVFESDHLRSLIISMLMQLSSRVLFDQEEHLDFTPIC